MKLRYLLSHSLVGHAAALGGATFIMAMCGIATNVIWTRWVPQEVFGGFKVIFAFVNIVGTVCLLGAGQAALMSAAQNADGNLIRLVRGKLLANVGGSTLLLLAAGYYAYGIGDSEPIAYGLLAAAILFPTYNIIDLWTSWLNGKGLFQELATGRALIYILPLISVVFISFFKITYIWLVVLIYFVLTSIQNIMMLRRIFLLRNNTNDDQGVLMHGRHATLAMMLAGITSLDVVILNHFFSTSDVAVYSVAFVLPELIRSILAVLNQLFAPKLNAGQSLSIFWKDYKGIFFIISTGLVALGIGGFIFLPVLVPFLFSESYIKSAEYSSWLWLVMASVGSLGVLGNALIATKKLVYVYGSFLGQPILLAAFYVIFAADGVSGMVMARILAMVALHLFYLLGFFSEINNN